MQATHGALFSIRGNARLGNDRLQAVLIKLPLAKAAGKETSFVIASLQLDDEGAFEPGLGENHERPHSAACDCGVRAKQRRCRKSGARMPSAIRRWIWAIRR